MQKEALKAKGFIVVLALVGVAVLGCSSRRDPSATPTAEGASPSEPAPASEPAAPAVATSVWDGVYSEGQRLRGEETYLTKCSSCHTRALRGGIIIPALVGEEFVDKWSSVGDLFEQARMTMPPDINQRLSREEYADVVAYILSKNEFPVGESDLATEFSALSGIRIEPSKASGDSGR